MFTFCRNNLYDSITMPLSSLKGEFFGNFFTAEAEQESLCDVLRKKWGTVEEEKVGGGISLNDDVLCTFTFYWD